MSLALQRIARSSFQNTLRSHAARSAILTAHSGSLQPSYTRQMCDIKSKHKVLSPHVTIYAFPVAAITSVTNRITGGLLWIGVTGVAATSLVGDVGCTVEAIKALTGPALPVAKFAVAFPLLYHYAYTCRHMFWEMNPAVLSTATATSSAYAVWAASLGGSIGLAAISI